MKLTFLVKTILRSTKVVAFFLVFLLALNNLYAQLDNPDWGDGVTECVPNALLYPGVAAVTCAVVTESDPADRYVIAYLSMNEGLSAVNRDTITNPDSVLHHTDWLVSNVGNVFGTAIKQSTAEVFVTSSSNYGAGFGFANDSPAILNYGSIGGINEVDNAGNVYRIDPVTGAVTVFASLPQQSTTLTHWDCEDDAVEIIRPNSGVGLGNIAYDEINDQFFVTNTEDGRIYRISNTGTILDSYDPFGLDNGIAGISDMGEVIYGLVVEPGGGRLLFGTVDIGMDIHIVDFSALEPVSPGAPEIHSIDLNTNGGFLSTTTNNTTPNTYSWDNFVGTEQLHSAIPTAEELNPISYTEWTSFFISDLAFNPDWELMVILLEIRMSVKVKI